jgi:nucleoside-diphosphate-sugar epimerase
MSYLVTGATGYLGSEMVRRLLSEKKQVAVLIRKESFEKFKKIFSENIKVLFVPETAEQLVKLFKNEKFDTVFHFAALFIAEHKTTDVENLILSNVLFSAQLAEACAESGVKNLISASTAWQNYHSEQYNPVCIYAATKQAAEDIFKFYAEARGLRVANIKIYDTYGPRDFRGKAIEKIFQAAGKNIKMSFSPGQQLLDMVYIDDVMDAFLQAENFLTLNASDICFHTFGLGTGQLLSLKDLVGLMEKTAGEKININWGARPYRQREVMNPTPLEPVPGWRAKVSLTEGLKKYYESIK